MAKLLVFLLLLLSTTTVLAASDSDPVQVKLPPLLKSDSGTVVATAAKWKTRRKELLRHLESEVYGNPLPKTPMALSLRLPVIQFQIQGNATSLVFDFPEINGHPRLNVLILEPSQGPSKNMIFIAENEAPGEILDATSSQLVDMGNYDDPIKDYHTGIEQGLAEGIGFAFVQVTSVFPDAEEGYNKALTPWLRAGDDNSPGALMSWASLVSDVREFESQAHPGQKQWVMGFSRFGKVAALALAIDPHFAGGVLHMSGSLGTTASRGNDRETVSSIAQHYPHWINGDLKKNTDPEHLSTDQHGLIALAAPRPVLVDDGNWDLWSNPQLALFTVEQASEVWEKIYHCEPLSILDADDKTLTFGSNQRLLHKSYNQIHSLLSNDWDLILSFVLNPRPAGSCGQ